ncbi:MAG: hypothetical protein M3258_00580 [Thermoproteota archaeon]|nr:hypothetical protein [Thermoproteota archaeon]
MVNCKYNMLPVASGIWMLIIVPAIIAFVFGIWVFYSVMTNLSKVESSRFAVVGPDTVRMKVDRPEG